MNKLTTITLAVILATVSTFAKCVSQRYNVELHGYVCKTEDETGAIRLIEGREVKVSVRLFDYQETVERISCIGGSLGYCYDKWFLDNHGNTIAHTSFYYSNKEECGKAFWKMVDDFIRKWEP